MSGMGYMISDYDRPTLTLEERPMGDRYPYEVATKRFLLEIPESFLDRWKKALDELAECEAILDHNQHREAWEFPK